MYATLQKLLMSSFPMFFPHELLNLEILRKDDMEENGIKAMFRCMEITFLKWV